MLQRGTRCGEEHDVAAWAIAGQAAGFFRNSVWALALAGRGGRGRRVGRGWWLRLDHRWLGLDLRGMEALARDQSSAVAGGCDSVGLGRSRRCFPWVVAL